MSMTDSRSTYESKDVVDFYVAQKDLQRPEKSIVDALASALPQARLLDVGIGGGRTTEHLAPLVREYVGVDYAAGMVEACRKRFGHLKNATFFEADARDLRDFPDASFDVVLFSFNGIDSINHDDRARAFRELKRVLRPGGYLWFSSHNKNQLPEVFSLQWPESANHLPGQIRRFVQVHLKNFPAFRHMRGDHARIYDGVLQFRAQIYYVDPRRQLRDLQELGFREIRTFGLHDGLEFPAREDLLAQRREAWIYFLCRRGPA